MMYSQPTFVCVYICKCISNSNSKSHNIPITTHRKQITGTCRVRLESSEFSRSKRGSSRSLPVDHMILLHHSPSSERANVQQVRRLGQWTWRPERVTLVLVSGGSSVGATGLIEGSSIDVSGGASK